MQTKTLILALSVALGVTAATTQIRARQDGAADFGDCDPTIDFQFGREGRGEDEGTFLPVDPLVAEGQQGKQFLFYSVQAIWGDLGLTSAFADALNPNIITVRHRFLG